MALTNDGIRHNDIRPVPPRTILSQPERDTRLCIVDTAERLFKAIGYQKTTVADIAKTLRMSPANVYRFFDSKKSINEAVLERYKGEQEQALLEISGRGGTASSRLRAVASRRWVSCLPRMKKSYCRSTIHVTSTTAMPTT